MSIPSEATAVNTFFSLRYDVPVRSLTSSRKARSVGRKAVTGVLPSASTFTALFGLALSTACTALSTMSKSFQLRSNPLPSLASTLARLRFPDDDVWAEAGGAAPMARAPATSRAAPILATWRSTISILLDLRRV